MKSDPIIIKKYPNRRLYNTQASEYITLEGLYQLVKQYQDFIVIDAKTGQDLTKNTLTQIIFEKETEGNNILSVSFLRQLIRYYDDNLRTILPEYLAESMELFSSNQEYFRNMIGKCFDQARENFFPLKIFGEMTKRNLEVIEQNFENFFPTSKPKDKE